MTSGDVFGLELEQIDERRLRALNLRREERLLDDVASPGRGGHDEDVYRAGTRHDRERLASRRNCIR